jgi:hypothetical protein
LEHARHGFQPNRGRLAADFIHFTSVRRTPVSTRVTANDAVPLNNFNLALTLFLIAGNKVLLRYIYFLSV